MQKAKRFIRVLDQKRAFLFSLHQFTVKHVAAIGRYETECRIGLSNGRLQLMFLPPHDLPLIAIVGTPYVGGKDESAENDRIAEKYWISSVVLFCFLRGQSWLDQDKTKLKAQTWRDLQTRMSEIEKMFSDQDTMREWVFDYIAYAKAIFVVPAGLHEWSGSRGE